MPPNVKVCINGFVLSTLLFDCTNNSGDNEGFLCGSITRSMRREISDHSMSNTQEDIVISICSTVPSGSFMSFYNNVGEIKQEELDYNLSDRNDNVVGWYRFRRYSALHPSAREQVVHKNLQSWFANYSKIDNSYFVFAILSSSNLLNFATHSYDYAFFIHRPNNQFRDLPLTILNLGDTRNSYRSSSMALPFMNSSSFNSVLQDSNDFNSFYATENQVEDLHERLRLKLNCLQQELAASDCINQGFEEIIQGLTMDLQTLLATQESEDREAKLNPSIIQRIEATTGTLFQEFTEKQSNNKDISEASSVNPKELENSQRKTAACGKEFENQEPKGQNNKKTDNDNESSAADVHAKVTNECLTKNDSKSNESQTLDGEKLMSFASCPEMELDSCESESSEEKENISSLKRAFDPEDYAKSSKRTCLDKYFEGGENIEDKAAPKSVHAVSSSKPKVTHGSPLLVLDPDSGETSTSQNTSHDIKSKNLASETEDKVPSPASNVEIGSVSELQVYESVVAMDEDVSSDEFSESKDQDAKEPTSMQCTNEVSIEMVMKKSLSDSNIFSTKGVAPDRCASAQAKIVSQVAEVELKDDSGLVLDESKKVDDNVLGGALNSRTCSTDESSSKVNPPFIIYAFKEYESNIKGPSPSKSNESSVQANVANCKIQSDTERSVTSPSYEPKDKDEDTVDSDKKD